jgi:hypothetical protein
VEHDLDHRPVLEAGRLDGREVGVGDLAALLRDADGEVDR